MFLYLALIPFCLYIQHSSVDDEQFAIAVVTTSILSVVILRKCFSGPSSRRDMDIRCRQENQDEELAEDTTAVPELEEVINRSKDEMQVASVSDLEEAIRPAESVFRKIQRHFVGMWESLWSVETHSTGPKEVKSVAGESETLVDMMRKLEWAYQQLYARDADIWQLRRGINLPQAQRITKEQGQQYTPNEQMKSREMVKTENMTESSGRSSGQFNASGTVSISEIDTEAVNSSVEDGPEDSSTRNSDIGEWLSIEKDQTRIREQGWSKLHKEEMNHSMTGNASRQSSEEARLRNEMNKIQESRDRIREKLEATQAQLGDAQRGLEHKDEEITALRTSLANARAGEENMGKTSEDGKSFKDNDDIRSFDEESTKGWEQPQSMRSGPKGLLKEGKPLSELVKNTGLLGKALSFRHRASLKKRKVPVYAQEAAMKLGSSSDVSSRASMSRASMSSN